MGESGGNWKRRDSSYVWRRQDWIMRTMMDGKIICNKIQIFPGTDVNRLCVWSDLQERWWVRRECMLFTQMMDTCLFSVPEFPATKEGTDKSWSRRRDGCGGRKGAPLWRTSRWYEAGAGSGNWKVNNLHALLHYAKTSVEFETNLLAKT